MNSSLRQFTAIAIIIGLALPAGAAGRRRAAEPAGGTYSGTVAWSASGGAPHLKHRRQVGYYIWHDGNTIHVESSGHTKQGHIFAGRIVVQGGTLGNVQPVKLERKEDHFQQVSPSELDFSFDTHGGTDTLVFNVSGGRVGFDFRIQGQPTSRVFVGPNAVEVVSHPVVIDTTR